MVALAGAAVSGGVAADTDAAVTADGASLDASVAGIASVDRTVTDTEVAPGGTTTVEVVVATDGELATGELVEVRDEFSPAFASVSLNDSTPGVGGAGAPPSNDEFRAVWNEDADAYTLRYDVRVPLSASPGDEFDITGTAAVGDESESLPSATITVVEGTPDTAAVSLAPTTESAAPGSETTYEVVVTGADEGVGSYALTVATDNASVGEITGVELTNDAATDATEIAADGSSVRIEADLGDDAHAAGNGVVIAEVTVAAGDPGATALAIDDAATIGNASGANYPLGLAGDATLQVTAATDPDDETTTANPGGTTTANPGGGTTTAAGGTAVGTTADGTAAGTDDGTDSGDGGSPGMGVVAALGAILGAGYLLGRERTDER